MPKFKYEARDRYGVKKKGIIVAETPEQAEELLKNREFQDIKIKLSKEKGKEKKKKKSGFKLFTPKVKEKDLAIFTRQLGAMISAGIGIADALEILSKQLPNATLSEALEQVQEDVTTGMSLSKAMERHPKVFPKFLVNLLASAEESGNLDIVLQRATVYYEKIAAIKRKIVSASWYPIAVLVIATLIVLGILAFIVPTFGKMYSEMGANLPILTQLLITLSDTLRNNFLYIVIFVIAFFTLVSYIKKTENGRKFIHSFMLKLPLLGEIFRKGAIAKFARTLSTLVSGGVPIIRSLEIAGTVSGNAVIEDAVENAKNQVEQGKNLYISLDEEVFTPIFISMAKVGEETGRLDEMLDTISDFFEDEVDRAVDGLLSTIEPILMVFIGGIVGFIIVALYLPIFKMGDLINR